MDPQKQISILHWASNVWGKKVETFVELKDGLFFLYVLDLLEHKTQENADQFQEVKKYFKDYYGKEARIGDILKFDQLIGQPAGQENDFDMELELAKITVFLLSQALFKARQIVATASLDLPLHMHGDIRNLVQAVVDTQCTDSAGSSTIEEVLRSPSGAEESFDENSMKAFFEKPLCQSLTPKEQRLLREMSPIEAPTSDGSASISDDHPKNSTESQSSISENLFPSRDGASSPPMRKDFSLSEPPMKSTPKFSKLSAVGSSVSKIRPLDSPLPLNVSTHNVSFGISSPFRALNISASSLVSPLANFIQSPEIIEKVLLKKKDLELNKLKRELNDQVYLCEDLQITIQDNIKTIANKDAEIEKLKSRVKELLRLQDANDELEEIKPELSALEVTIEKLNSKILKLEPYRSQCQILEKENSEQLVEIRQLHEEVKSLQVENGEKRDLLLIKSQMEIQIKTLDAQLSEVTKSKAELEDKCSVVQGKLAHTTERYDQLQEEFELRGSKNDSVQGESMGVIVEIQLGELKMQVEELTQIRTDLTEELKALKESLSDKEREILEANQQYKEQEEAKSTLETKLITTQEDLINLKEETSSKDAHIEEMNQTISDLNVKLEEERSAAAEQKISHEALMSEQLKAVDDVTEKCREYEEQILSLNKDIKDLKNMILSEQEKNSEMMLQLTSRDEEIMSAKKVEENSLREIDDLKKEINSLNKERETLTENVVEEGNKLSECKQILDEKDQELSNVKTTLEELRTIVGEKDGELSALAANMALKESAEEEMTKNIGSLKNCINEREEELEDMKSKQVKAISTMEEKIRLIVEEKEIVTQSLDVKCAEIEEIKEKLKSKETDFSSLQGQYANANVAVSELQERVKCTEENLLVTKQQLEDKNTEFTLLQEKLLEETKDHEQKTKENEEQRALVKDLESKCESLEEKKVSLSHQVDEKCQEVESMRNWLAETQKEHVEGLKAMREEMSVVQSQLEQKSQEVEELLSQRDDAVSEIKILETRFADVESEISSVRSDLQSKIKTLSGLEEEKEAAAKEIASLHTQVDLLLSKEKDVSDDHSRLVCQLRLDLEQKTSSISSLRHQLEENEQQLKDKNSIIENNCVQIKDLEDQLAVLKARLEEYKQEIISQKTEKDKFCSITEDKLQTMEKEKIDLTEVIASKNEELETLKRRFEEKEVTYSVAQEKSSHSGTAVLELEKEKMDLTSLIDSKNDELETLNSRLEEKEIAYSASQEKCSRLDTVLSELEMKVKALEENCSSLTHQLAEKESETSTLMEAIGEKDKELQRYVHDTSEHEKHVTTLQEELNSLEKEHTDLKCKLENMLSEVSFFQKALEDSESKNKEFEIKYESSLSEQSILLKRYEDKFDELSQLKHDTEESERNHESQLLAFKGEISYLKSDIQNKEEEIGKLRQECEDKSFQLTEKQTEVIALMASSSNDQKNMETKLLDYSHQVSDVIAQIKQKEEEMSAKDKQICDLNLRIEQQDKVIEDLTLNVEQVRASLVEMQCLKESSETARDEVKEKLEEKEYEVTRLEADMNSQEERRLKLVQRLEEEVSHLQQQAAILEDKDNLICQLEKELSMMKDVKETLNLKEQELSLLSEQCHAMKESQKDEMNLLICSILSYLGKSIESGTQNLNEEIELTNITEDTISAIQSAVEEIRQKYEAIKVDLEREVVEGHEEIESKCRKMVDEMKLEREEERKLEKANHELEMAKAKEEVELIWREKWNDYQLQVTEEKNSEAAKYEREVAQLRESLTDEWDENFEDLRSQFATDLREQAGKFEREKERLQEELNDGWQEALDDLKLRFEAAKASEMKALSQQKSELLELKENYEAKLMMQRMETDKILKSVHEENTKLLERETLHLKNTETQMKTANEYCNSLKKQLDGATGKLTALEQEMRSLKESNQKQNEQMAKIRETNESLNSALYIERDTNTKLQQRVENHIAKLNNSKMLMEKTQLENKNYAVEVNKLRTSLDYSERKLQEYKHQLELTGTALLGDSSHFRGMIQAHDNALDDSLMQKDAHTPRYHLRSSTETRQSFFSSPNETIISGDTVMLQRESLASSSDIRKNATPRSRLSISSTTSSLSNKSVSGLPPGMRPNMQSCANEPEQEFEWDRLSELQRRNTLCLPHMKSSYPVEVQNVKKEKFSDDSLRLSLMPRRKATPDGKGVSESGKLGKRKSPATTKQTDLTSPKQKKPEVSPGGTVLYFPLAKDGPIYPPSRPPTPGKQRRYGKAPTSSPHSGTRRKVLGSTIARRKQHTPSPRKSPRLNPKSPRVVNRDDHENKLQESIAFDIGFTPDKKGSRKGMQKKRNALATTIATPVKTLTSVKQMLKEADDATLKQETEIFRDNPSEVRKKSVTFCSDVLEKDSNLCLETPVHGKEMTKTKGKVAKLVSLFTSSHRAQKASGKGPRRSQEKAKQKVSPRRSFRLQSPLMYTPLSQKSPFMSFKVETQAALSSQRKKTQAQSVFPTPDLLMLKDCTTPVTPKDRRPRKKLFTPNKITPGIENSREDRPLL